MQAQQGQVWSIVGSDRIVVILSPDDVCRNEQDIRVALMSPNGHITEDVVLVNFNTDIIHLTQIAPYSRMLIELWNDFGIFKSQLDKMIGWCTKETQEKIKRGLRRQYCVGEFENMEAPGLDPSNLFIKTETEASRILAQPLIKYYYDLASQDEDEEDPNFPSFYGQNEWHGPDPDQNPYVDSWHDYAHMPEEPKTPTSP